MKMMPLIALLLILPISSATLASSGGSWSRLAGGCTLTVGNQTMSSPSLLAPEGLAPDAHVMQISWRIVPLSPVPAGFTVQLCRSDQCRTLPTLNGSLRLKQSVPAAGDFRFVYTVAHKGQLHPAVTVVSNQLTVSYR